MENTNDSTESNPLEIEAQADDLEAEALRLRAIAKRRRAEMERATTTSVSEPCVHMTRAAYAQRSGVSEATVSRWITEGMPVLPVGSTVRIDPTDADTWRRQRGRKPTKAATVSAAVEVDADLARAGLRMIGGAR